MSEVLVLVGVVIAAFVSTNLDNLFLLMALLGGPRRGTTVVSLGAASLGYVAAMAVVLGAGLAGSYAADLVSDAWLGYLGVVPLSMGVWRIRGLVGGARAEPAEAPPPASSGASVFGVMLANSGDSLGVFAPLMSETAELLVVVAIVTALAMSVLWVRAAKWVVDHPRLAPRLERIERYAVPPLLIAVGLYILSDTATDTL